MIVGDSVNFEVIKGKVIIEGVKVFVKMIVIYGE